MHVEDDVMTRALMELLSSAKRRMQRWKSAITVLIDYIKVKPLSV
jgi:hypothetical protein